MANKLISDLNSATVLVTDLIEHQPIAGPPSKKADISALFSDAGGIPAIDRDARQLINSANAAALDWENSRADAGGQPSLNWGVRRLQDAAGQEAAEWGNRLLLDSGEVNSVDWDHRGLIGSDGSTTVVDWSRNQLLDSASGVVSVDWENRLLFASDGLTAILNFTVQQPSSGAKTAGIVYDATTKTMIQEMYDAMRQYGLLS